MPNAFIKSGDGQEMKARLSNEYGRQFKSSPIFVFNNAATMAQNGEEFFDFETDQPTSAKYLPFNNIRVANTSTSNINVIVNGNRSKPYFIPSGDITVLPADIYPNVRTVRIVNLDSTSITAGQIRCFAYKDVVTADLTLKRVHTSLFQNFVNIWEKNFSGVKEI